MSVRLGMSVARPPGAQVRSVARSLVGSGPGRRVPKAARRTPGARGRRGSVRGTLVSVSRPRHPTASLRADGPLTAARFLADVHGGNLHVGPRGELRAGVVVSRPPAEPACADVLARLERRLARVVARAPRAAPGVGVPIALERAPLVRLGPADVLRPELALVAPPRQRRPPTGSGLGGSFDASSLLLVAEAACHAGDDARLGSYAAAGVREVWWVDVAHGWTEALRSPWAGRFRSRTLWYPGEAVPIAGLWSVAVEALPRP